MSDDDKLLVFISWSKPLAMDIATALKDLLLVAFDNVIPWMSDQDIELGSRSMDVLGETLSRSSFGIVIVTKQNQYSQWINFEAGALSKKLEDPDISVVPLLVNFERTTDLVGPLSQFQAIILNRETIRRLMIKVGRRTGVPPEMVERRFSLHWDDFDQAVKAAVTAHPDESPQFTREEKDVQSEMLAILRQLQKQGRTIAGSNSTFAGWRTEETTPILRTLLTDLDVDATVQVHQNEVYVIVDGPPTLEKLYKLRSRMKNALPGTNVNVVTRDELAAMQGQFWNSVTHHVRNDG